MIKLPDIIRTVYISCTGEQTKQIYAGMFRVKVALTNAERLEVERMYAQLLPNDKQAAEANRLRASALAELSVRVVDAPSWWRNSRSGQDLLDSQPLWDLLVKIDELINEWTKSVEETAKTTMNHVPVETSPPPISPNNKIDTQSS
ncbi:MAG: hypothetical protein QXT45_06850 [Candidatus Bilamarchaeaceae archaeon]